MARWVRTPDRRRDRDHQASIFAAPLRDPGLFAGGAAGFACPGAFASTSLPHVPDGVPVFIDIETGHLDALAVVAVVAILRRTTVVYANAGNAQGLADRLAGGSVAALAGGALVVTHGAAGCRVHHARRTWDVPGITVETVDTTGAGDSFAAAFTVAWLRGHGPETAGRFANVVAALSTRTLGFRDGVPDRVTLDRIGPTMGSDQAATLVAGQ